MKNTFFTLLISFAFSLSAFGACPTIIMSGQQVTCYGASNGQATVNILGMTGNYTFTWSNGVTASGPSGSTISNLPAGTYTVSVRDNTTGCTVTGAYVVGQPDQIIITGSSTNVNCRGNNTGSVTINVTGGTGPYSYNWLNSSGTSVATTQNLSNAFAGVYTVVVHAPNASCSASATFTVSQPAENLQAAAIITNVNCFAGSTGAIDLSVWGGTPPYSYSWSNLALTQDIQNLTAGTYEVTITDELGCTLTQSFNVTQPNELIGSTFTSPVDCFGNSTGTITANVNGGVGPYNYVWSNNMNLYAINSNVLINVPAGNYQANVTDANGCQITLNGTISQPSELILTTSSTDVNCFGGNDGSLSSVTSGSVAPYNYLWTNSLGNNIGNTANISGVGAGTYTLLVTDANGCSKTSQEVISQPETPIIVSFVKTDVLCFGESTGQIQLNVAGGTPSYSYIWSDGSITPTITNLVAGNYSYEVTDANGCQVLGSIEIEQPNDPIQVIPTITDVSCFGFSDGVITLSVSGGTTNYTFQWQNSQFLLSQTGPSLMNFPANSYRYEITDANGCKAIDTLQINQPTELTSAISGANILCRGENTGSVSVIANGGVSPYSYSWNTGDVVPNINNLFAGLYEVTIVDDNNCVTTNSILLTEPDDTLGYSFTTTDVLCNDGNNGMVNLTVTGGTTPYAYDWSNGDNIPVITGLTAGMYSFVVTDNNGCTVQDSMEIFQPDPLEMNETITNASCFGFSDGIIDIEPTGGTGPYTYTWFNSMFALSSTQQDLINYPADIYQVIIEDTNNCIYESFFEITHPDPLEVSYTFTPISCFNGTDGNIIVTVSGGTEDYYFDWSNGAITQNQMNVPIGVYTLLVTDEQGCEENIEVTLDEPEPITMSFTSTEVSCIDQFDGTAQVFPQGGNGGYNYNWNNGEISDINIGLSNQWYYITVTDILGCFGQDSVFINKNNIGCIDPVNTFSPNGDNYNDTWVIDNLELYPDMHMQVYNKWGVLIYNAQGIYEPWDGTQNDRPLPSEVYYYILKLNNVENDILTGNITIIR
jgi:gliding motility-associated-like protein